MSRPYPLSNRHRAAVPHHTALINLLDPWTEHRIRGLVPSLLGLRCLEVGAGSGSIARWLAHRVDDHGQVVALDQSTDLITAHPRITVVRHDLTSPGPWPQEAAGPFDLIHTRLTLHHLPTRWRVLDQLVQLLAPGGVLLVQDWAGRSRFVMQAPTPEDAELVDGVQERIAATFDAAGTDRAWAPGLHQALQQAGLVEVQTEVYSSYWPGGGPGTQLVAAVIEQLAPKLGLPEEDLDRVRALLAHPGLVLHGHPLYSVSGRRAGSADSTVYM